MFVNVKAYSVKWIACIIGEGGVQREISLFILNGIHFIHLCIMDIIDYS